MARKLLCMMALISLVLLTQAIPGLAAEYDLPGVNEELWSNYTNSWTPDTTWTETHGINEYFQSKPGSADGNFWGSYYSSDGYTWSIGDIKYSDNDPAPIMPVSVLANSAAAIPVYNDDESRFTVTIVYDQVMSPGTVKFSVDIPGIPEISATNFTLTATAEYDSQMEGGVHWKCWGETIFGYGTNDLDNDAPFTISGTLVQSQSDSNHYGTIDDLKLIYNSTPTPIPGAVWLLGTGLVGLGLVGRRRRRG